MIKRYPLFWLLLFLVLYSLAWHFSLLVFSPFPILESKHAVSRLILLYPIIYFLLSAPILALFLKYPSSLKLATGATLLFLFSLLTRVVDWNIIYYYGSHIDSLFWENAFFSDGLGMIFTEVMLVLLFISIILTAIYILLLRTVRAHYFQWLDNGFTPREYFFKQYLHSFIILFGLALALILLVQSFFSSYVSSPVYTYRLPENRFFSSIQDYLSEEKIENIILSEEEITRLKKMGLKLESTSKEYPLMKDSIFIDKDRRVSPLASRPNIIIIMFESLSSYFIEDPDLKKHNLTPNIDNFILRSLYFDKILNAITPTLQGQIAILSSSLHLYRSTMDENTWSVFEDVKDQFKDREAAVITTYPMISNLLKASSYTSTHIQGGPGGFGNTERFFRLMGGFDQFYSAANEQVVQNRKLPLGIWGASDIDTFRLATQWLSNNQHNPFLLTISSIDIHHPYHTDTKKDGVDNNLLNCVYSSDAGFGVFWDYFLQSPYKDNTIVVLTSDHPIFPTADYLQLRKQQPGYYDNIPLVIYSPFHPHLMGTRDNTIGTNLDIAPTILELIGQDSMNAFLGLSLLSERKRYPHYLGRINLEKRFNNNPVFWNDNEQVRFIKYLKSLSMRNMLYKTSSGG